MWKKLHGSVSLQIFQMWMSVYTFLAQMVPLASTSLKDTRVNALRHGSEKTAQVTAQKVQIKTFICSVASLRNESFRINVSIGWKEALFPNVFLLRVSAKYRNKNKSENNFYFLSNFIFWIRNVLHKFVKYQVSIFQSPMIATEILVWMERVLMETIRTLVPALMATREETVRVSYVLVIQKYVFRVHDF